MSSEGTPDAEIESTLNDNDPLSDAIRTLPPDTVEREDDEPITSGVTGEDDAPVLEEQEDADLLPEKHVESTEETGETTRPLNDHDEDASSLPDDTPSVQVCLA